MPKPETAEGKLPDVASLSYEQARDELASLVRRLETGSVPLEESMAMWERGEALGRHCEAILTGALARLDAATPDGGRPGTEATRPSTQAGSQGPGPAAA